MPILTITDLGHLFGAEDIFSDINLMLKRKERVGLVGPNGVGKTTLLLILAGLLESTRWHCAAQLRADNRLFTPGGGAYIYGSKTIQSLRRC